MIKCFQAWFDVMQKWEGGLSDHPADKGGLTNRGITWATFQTYAKRVGLPATQEALRNLTSEQASRFAKIFWDGVNGDNLPCGAAIIIADWSWGSGYYGRVRAQRALGVTSDGVIGPATVAAANAQDPMQLVDSLYKAREQHFADIVRADPTQAVFLTGWRNRNASMYNLARAFALQDIAEKKKFRPGPGGPGLRS